MFAKIGSHGLASKFQKFPGLVLALVVLFSALPVGKAYAWSYFTPTGSPGAATIPTVYVSDLLIGGVTLFSLQTNTGPAAYRSPATTGAQRVSAIYAVEKWNGSAWAVITRTVRYSGQIGATQNFYRFPALNIQPSRNQGYFRVSWVFSWHTTTGVFLGSTAVISNLTNDHVCLTTTHLCFTAPGYFYHY